MSTLVCEPPAASHSAPHSPASRKPAEVHQHPCELHEPVDFIYSPQFEEPHAARQFEDAARRARQQAEQQQPSRPARVPKGLPPFISRLYEVRLLTAEEERAEFCRMNFHKFRAQLLEQGDSPDGYHHAIRRAERELETARAIRDRLIEANLRLVVSIAKRFVSPELPLEELISDGNVALMRAVEKFDFGRGYRFSTYATYAVSRNYYRSFGRRQRQRHIHGSDGSDFLEEITQESQGIVRDEKKYHRLEGTLGRMLEQLDPREQRIIRARYALEGLGKKQTLQKLAAQMGVCKERVRQLEKRALGKLKKAAAAEQLNEDVLPE